MKRILLALIPLFAVVACGGSVFENGGNGGGDDSNGDGGSGGDGSTGGDGGLAATSCPSAEPSSGGSCTPEGIDCEYGTSNGTCENEHIDCKGGEWTFPPPVPGPACLPNNACPASHSSIVVGANCGAQEMECDYAGQGRCTCATQGYGGLQPYNPDGGPLPNVWECETPSDNCPVDRPRLGSACSDEAHSCMYGNCNMPDSVGIQCTNGIWVNAPYACAG